MEKFLEKNLTLKNFAKYVTPSILMFFFIAFYSLVDGFFVSEFVGTNALAAINIAIPLTGILSGIAVMLSSGSCAFVSIKMGEGKASDASRKFSFVCIVAIVSGILFSTTSPLWLRAVLKIIGATDILIDNAYIYAFIFLLFSPLALLSIVFEYYIRIDGKPSFTLILYVIGGLTNIICDYLFVFCYKWGVLGAALGTCLSFLSITIIGSIYFFKFSSTLKFTKPDIDFKFLFMSCLNGISEMISECAASITTMIANLVIIAVAGEDGVAALTIVLYIHFMFISINLGYITGVSPIISYCYGAKQFRSINKCYTYSKRFIMCTSFGAFLLAQIGASQFIMIFVEQGTNVYDIAIHGLKILGFSFLFTGVNIFASGMFTAYGNGRISAVISLSNNLIILLVSLLILPKILGIDGIWAAIPVTELITAVLSLFLMFYYRKQYNYIL